MNPLLSIALLIFVVVMAIVLEGRRQARRLRERGEPEAEGRANLLGAGTLELQGILQPDRKVEVMQMQLKEGEITQARGDAESGDDPEPGDGAQPGGAGPGAGPEPGGGLEPDGEK